MNEIERKQKIWSEIIEEIKNQSEDKREGEFTIREFMDATGIRVDKARMVLRDKVQAGVFGVRKTKRVYYYYIV